MQIEKTFLNQLHHQHAKCNEDQKLILNCINITKNKKKKSYHRANYDLSPPKFLVFTQLMDAK